MTKQLADDLKQIRAALEVTVFKTLTLPQAAEFLCISRSRLYQLTSKSEIPFYRPTGGKILFSRSELVAWVQKKRSKPLAEIEEEVARDARG